MTTEQVIGCAPFRLQAPRPLTPYEWSVVFGSVLEGFARAGLFAAPDTHAAATALVGAVAAQNACPAWRTSAFGPAPAVAVLPYECLGEWFARLDYPTRQRALGDIAATPLLCGPNVPWTACGTDPRRLAQAWEGAAQLSVPAPGVPVETCAEPRSRTSYIPTTVEELLKMFRALGGQVPAVVEQGYSMLPAAARQRSVLLGVQLKPPTAALPEILATNPIALAQALVEEVAIVWAPGKGSSLTGMLSGNVDPRGLLELAAAMMPDLLGGLLSGGGLPTIPGLPDLGTILGTLGGLFGQQKRLVPGLHGLGAGPAPTSGKTGVAVVDVPGDRLDRSEPIPGLRAATTTTFSPVAAAGLAAAAVAGVWLIYRYA